jgi:hypothetical protein
MTGLFSDPAPRPSRWKWVCRLAALVLIFWIVAPRSVWRGRARANVSDELVKKLMAFDRNGDGKLDRSEVPERMQGLFDRADSNKDGFLTVEEIRTLAEAVALPVRR